MSHDPPPPPPGGPPAWGQPGDHPYGGYGYGGSGGFPGYQAPPPVLGTATTAMVLGIVSLVILLSGVLCLVTSPFAIIPGPFAIWLGVKARREIETAPHRWSGSGQALAGLICGIVGTVLGLIATALVVLFLVFIGVSINEATTY